jgi:hypothetical protein
MQHCTGKAVFNYYIHEFQKYECHTLKFKEIVAVSPDTAVFPQKMYRDFLDQHLWHIPDQLFYALSAK